MVLLHLLISSSVKKKISLLGPQRFFFRCFSREQLPHTTEQGAPQSPQSPQGPPFHPPTHRGSLGLQSPEIPNPPRAALSPDRGKQRLQWGAVQDRRGDILCQVPWAPRAQQVTQTPLWSLSPPLQGPDARNPTAVQPPPQHTPGSHSPCRGCCSGRLHPPCACSPPA